MHLQANADPMQKLLPMLQSVWEYLAPNWALVSILMTVLFIVVTSWLILRKYVKLMLNIIRDTPPPLSMGPCDFQRIDGKKVVFRAFDNLNLRGMFLFTSRGPARGMVLSPMNSRATCTVARVIVARC